MTSIEVERNRQVLYAPGRRERVTSAENTSSCPFCPGNEFLTPPEVWAYNPEGWFDRSPNTPGWEVRIIPNKKPFPGVPDSEVVISSPDHQGRTAALLLKQLEKVFFGVQERYRHHGNSGKASLFFINEGKDSGSTQEHPHGQLFTGYAQDLTDYGESPPLEQIITESDHFILYCPGISEWPLEMALRPKVLEGDFSNFSDEELGELAKNFKAACLTLEKTPLAQELAEKTWRRHDGRVPYNVYLKRYLLNGRQGWYFRFCPRLAIPAGFELATGVMVNTVTPQEAAQSLREVLVNLPPVT